MRIAVITLAIALGGPVLGWAAGGRSATFAASSGRSSKSFDLAVRNVLCSIGLTPRGIGENLSPQKREAIFPGIDHEAPFARMRELSVETGVPLPALMRAAENHYGEKSPEDFFRAILSDREVAPYLPSANELGLLKRRLEESPEENLRKVFDGQVTRDAAVVPAVPVKAEDKRRAPQLRKARPRAGNSNARYAAHSRWAPALRNFASWTRTHEAFELGLAENYRALADIGIDSKEGRALLRPLIDALENLKPGRREELRDAFLNLVTFHNHDSHPQWPTSVADQRVMIRTLDEARAQAAIQVEGRAERLLDGSIRGQDPPSRDKKAWIKRLLLASRTTQRLSRMAFYSDKINFELGEEALERLEELQRAYAARWKEPLPDMPFFILTPGAVQHKKTRSGRRVTVKPSR